MRKLLTILGIVAFVGGISLSAEAQKVQKSPKSVLTQTVGLTDISVTYFRPGLKGRDMASMVKDGAVWRTGASRTSYVNSGGFPKPGEKALWQSSSRRSWD